MFIGFVCKILIFVVFHTVYPYPKRRVSFLDLFIFAMLYIYQPPKNKKKPENHRSFVLLVLLWLCFAILRLVPGCSSCGEQETLF